MKLETGDLALMVALTIACLRMIGRIVLEPERRGRKR